MNDNKLLEIAKFCEDLSTGEFILPKRYKVIGLCSIIDCYFNRCLHRLVDVTKYDNYSGDVLFPVPGCDPIRSAFAVYYQTSNLWDRHTKYGKERYRFCGWVGEELRKKVHE